MIKNGQAEEIQSGRSEVAFINNIMENIRCDGAAIQ